MTGRVYVDRSRVETAQRCRRQRWLEYHEGGTGVVSARKPLPLAVGGSVHEGLAALLRGGTELVTMVAGEATMRTLWQELEDDAVAVALADFATFQGALEVDVTERPRAAAPGAPESPFGEASIDPLDAVSGPSMADFDAYLYAEQAALVEALVRAYARRRLQPLLAQFEVLEVEREGTWTLDPGEDGGPEILFMSRPDALLLEKATRQLHLLSFKTAASWDVRKERDAQHDMQGLSEGVEIERRLADAWRNCRTATGKGIWAVGPTASHQEGYLKLLGVNQKTLDYLTETPAPPRILAVRYEYLLKGERWRDRDLSAALGVEARSQKSHLVRQYVATSTPARGTAAFAIGDVCWSWDYVREVDGRDTSLAWQNWKARPVWDQPGGVRAWIDKLADAAEAMSPADPTLGMEPVALGYQCDAQTLGYTRQHPLDAVFIPPMTVYRNEDDLRDWVEQVEAQERGLAAGVRAVNAAPDEGERRAALNAFFPQHRRACEYPTTCAYVRVCYGGDDIRRDPVGSGQFKARVPNHPQEGNGNG